MNTHIFETDKDIEECKRRIDRQVVSAYTAGALCGKVNFSRDAFHIVKTPARYRNPFARYFYGRISRTEQGSMIRGSFRLHTIVRLLMAVWFGGLIYGVGRILVPGMFAYFLGASFGWDIIQLAGLLTFLCFGVILVITGALLGRKEESAVLEFIKTTLHVKHSELRNSAN